jgi:hypothetical protein
MAVSSLNKMSVNVNNTNQGLLMPKLKYRFRAVLENFGSGNTPTQELTKQVIDVSRPEVSFENMDIHVYNSIVKLAGKHSWGDITVNLRDDATGSISKLVGEQLQKQFDFMEQASAAAGINYKFTMRYEVLDGGNGAFEPTVLETWELYGCYVQSVNYGDMNYSESAPMTVGLTIRFDNAVQTEAGGQGGVGTNVGRELGSTAI